MKEIIGFSVGDFANRDLNVALEVLENVDCNAIELNFPSLDSLLEFVVTDEIKKKLEKFEYISVHEPLVKSKDDEIKLIKKLEELNSELNFKCVVFHPDIIFDFELLSKSNLPIAIENMDILKDTGKNLEFFEKLEKYDFKFVLDLQHVYENDNEMKLGEELIKLWGDRLAELHVSGESKVFCHDPVYRSDNKDAIAKLLRKINGVPIILEGKLDNQKYDYEIENELKFIRGI